jgi:site-specific recombinase XerD
LSKFQYASRDHALFALLWNTGLRTGATRPLDLEDCHCAEQYVELAHRPETNTPLKNGEDSEREVNLSSSVGEVLAGHVEHQRIDTEDEYGRSPLFTTQHGRISQQAFLRIIRGLA